MPKGEKSAKRKIYVIAKKNNIKFKRRIYNDTKSDPDYIDPDEAYYLDDSSIMFVED